jgi:hypothetical protein
MLCSFVTSGGGSPQFGSQLYTMCCGSAHICYKQLVACHLVSLLWKRPARCCWAGGLVLVRVKRSPK